MLTKTYWICTSLTVLFCQYSGSCVCSQTLIVSVVDLNWRLCIFFSSSPCRWIAISFISMIISMSLNIKRQVIHDVMTYGEPSFCLSSFLFWYGGCCVLSFAMVCSEKKMSRFKYCTLYVSPLSLETSEMQLLEDYKCRVIVCWLVQKKYPLHEPFKE